MWCHKNMGKSFQLFDTNWEKLSIDVSLLPEGLSSSKVLQRQSWCCRFAVDVRTFLLSLSPCFFWWSGVTQRVAERSGVLWGLGGGIGLWVGSGGGYMAEFPRMLATDEKDKEILFLWTRGFSAWLPHCWGDELSGWDFINNSYGDWGQRRSRFSHKLDLSMNAVLCLPWPCMA